MTLPVNKLAEKLKKLTIDQKLQFVDRLRLEQIVGKSKRLPFGVTQKSLQKLQRDLLKAGFPKPGKAFSVLVYVSGPITPTKYCPDMNKNRERIHRAALSLFLLGYTPYCPSVPWFDDPSTYNIWYFRILLMDVRFIADRCEAFYVCKASRTSTGVNVEEPIAFKAKQPRYFESERDRKYFEQLRQKK